MQISACSLRRQWSRKYQPEWSLLNEYWSYLYKLSNLISRNMLVLSAYSLRADLQSRKEMVTRNTVVKITLSSKQVWISKTGKHKDTNSAMNRMVAPLNIVLNFSNFQTSNCFNSPDKEEIRKARGQPVMNLKKDEVLSWNRVLHVPFILFSVLGRPRLPLHFFKDIMGSKLDSPGCL